MTRKSALANSRLIRLLAALMLAGYGALLVYWMLFGFGRRVQAAYQYNLIPFRTIRQYLHFSHFNATVGAINLGGNIGVFIPFGILLPLVLRRPLRFTLPIFLSGLLILEPSWSPEEGAWTWTI